MFLQSIIEEEGANGCASLKSTASNSTDDNAAPGSGHNNTSEPNNWDQPLIVAEPDVKVWFLVSMFFIAILVPCTIYVHSSWCLVHIIDVHRVIAAAK